MHASLFSPAWFDAPHSLVLEPGWAHVFRLNLDPVDPLPSITWECLSAEERDRSARLRNASLRQRFCNAHVQMRHILAEYLNCPAAAIQFTMGSHGKPSLSAEEKLHFNLSHSAGKGLLAACKFQNVGIDIEGPRKNLERESIARRFFAPNETAAIAALPQELQTRAFFACWTRKEAYIKGRGGGLSIPLDSFEVSVIPGEPITLYDPITERSPNLGWTLYEIDPGEGFGAALAVEGALKGIRCWNWKARSN